MLANARCHHGDAGMMKVSAEIERSRGLPSSSMLVDRVRRGDASAFELLIRRNNRRLFRIARGVLRNDAEAEEVVQETYVTAYEKLGTFRGPDGFSAWVGRIALNLALATVRRRARFRTIAAFDGEHPHPELAYGLAEVFGTEPSPEALTERHEMREILERTIDKLPADFRMVFVLRDVEGLSISETSAILGLKSETVRTRLHRARAALRRSLREEAITSLSSVFPFAGERCDRITAIVLARLGLAKPGPDSMGDTV